MGYFDVHDEPYGVPLNKFVDQLVQFRTDDIKGDYNPEQEKS